jgi:uncharacterized protein involved in type VI secretion and phage assembly
MNLESAVADLMERAERRFYGKYRASVVDNEDPMHLGRLKLTVPSVFGPDVVTGWATPCQPYGGAADQGLLFVPERGARVWAEFEEGDLEFPIWVGAFWCSPASGAEIPGDPQRRPTRKIIKTLKGHTLELEDADGAERIVLRDGAHSHAVTLDGTGITVTDATGNTIRLTDSAMTLTAKVPFTIDAAGQPAKIICSSLAIEKG